MNESNAAITPEQFTAQMRQIAQDNDSVTAHIDADGLMARLLEQLGYAEGVAIYDAMRKWYE